MRQCDFRVTTAEVEQRFFAFLVARHVSGLNLTDQNLMVTSRMHRVRLAFERHESVAQQGHASLAGKVEFGRSD